MLKHTFTTTSPTSPVGLVGNGNVIIGSGVGLLTRHNQQQQQSLDNCSLIMETSAVNAPRNDFNNRYSSSRATATTTTTLRHQPPPTSQLQHQQQLNISTLLNSSKHSIGGSSSISPVHNKNGGLNISTTRMLHAASPTTRAHHHTKYNNNTFNNQQQQYDTNNRRNNNNSPTTQTISASKRNDDLGIKEMLISLGLLCLISLLLALLSLIFLLKISPVTANDIREILRAEQLTLITAEEYVVVYEVTLALCALTLSLNLCCLLVCAIQFLFTVKLVKSPHGGSDRTNKYLQKSSISRVCAVAGFFISIPVFLTGIILYTFIQFHSTPAIVTSGFIGLGIVFCGCAMVHNVFIWQREKTNAVKARAKEQRDAAALALIAANQSTITSNLTQHQQNHHQTAIASSTQIFNGTSQNISITNPNLLNTSSTTNNNNNNHFNNNNNHNNMIMINSSHLSQHSAAASSTTGVGIGVGVGGILTSPTGAGHYTNNNTITGGQHRRDASGSISPTGLNNNTSVSNMIIDKNSSSISPHELSTLV